jgi:hypothetical protein
MDYIIDYNDCILYCTDIKNVKGDLNMVDTYENKSKELDKMRFCHEQEVEIISGFYRGNYGTVTGYCVSEKKIFYNVNIDRLNIVLLIDEADMKEHIVKNIFGRVLNKRKK